MTIRLKARADNGCSWRTPRERVYTLQIGTRKGPFAMGAGYIGGATLFVAIHCVHPLRNHYITRVFQCGFTRNANRVPYSRH